MGTGLGYSRIGLGWWNFAWTRDIPLIFGDLSYASNLRDIPLARNKRLEAVRSYDVQSDVRSNRSDGLDGLARINIVMSFDIATTFIVTTPLNSFGAKRKHS